MAHPPKKDADNMTGCLGHRNSLINHGNFILRIFNLLNPSSASFSRDEQHVDDSPSISFMVRKSRQIGTLKNEVCNITITYLVVKILKLKQRNRAYHPAQQNM